ncbi:hypothetical protein NPIL_522951 [Nephila pilipes]|uniref:Uncharacterized protein n=1 Tax=Nephila pilipes TaxID=299642 RepID=A0A8X6U3S5_NEPPI|nr:hypothetical protein NPIL_522951 [Nephila pilipes]
MTPNLPPPSESEDIHIHCIRRREVENRIQAVVKLNENYKNLLELMKNIRDYDSEHPYFIQTWNHYTETEKQLCQLEGCDDSSHISGTLVPPGMQEIIDRLNDEDHIEILTAVDLPSKSDEM